MTKSIKQLDEMRKNRDIRMTHISYSCGVSANAWGTAVSRGVASLGLRKNAVRVFDYFDENGYLPERKEIHLEQAKPGKVREEA